MAIAIGIYTVTAIDIATVFGTDICICIDIFTVVDTACIIIGICSAVDTGVIIRNWVGIGITTGISVDIVVIGVDIVVISVDIVVIGVDIVVIGVDIVVIGVDIVVIRGQDDMVRSFFSSSGLIWLARL